MNDKSKDKGTRIIEKLSQEGKRLNRLLETVATEVKSYADYQLSHIRRLSLIGMALSAEKDINKLLEMIVDEARALSLADAGTLYILDSGEKCLCFKIMQNDTMKTRMGGASGVEIDLPPVPLEVGGKPNYCNVSSYAALTGEIVNIPDVYEAEGFDFTGPRKYDETTGYRSKSMLVIPMKNHENDIIGVLQLLNAKDLETGEVIPFPEECVDLIASLASQAGIALTNAQLVQDLKDLLYSFIKSIATAIDEKSPYTAGHFNRVVNLTMMIAKKINEMGDGPFADVHFSDDELEELKVAAWMHDVGKITTPEYVVDKRTKLEMVFDRIGHIETRFDLIAKSIENGCLKEKLKLAENGRLDSGTLGKLDERLGEEPDRSFGTRQGYIALKELDERLEEELKVLMEEKEFVASCNMPGEFMSDEKIERLREIAAKTYELDGREHRYLTDDELYNLSVTKGSLTPEERKVIENHAMVTYKMLEQLPFPRKLSKVPIYASGHHENLDGSGYPLGLAEDELPIQARIMAVADVFEALTARDRPYKKPMKLSQAIKILGYMKDDKQIDPDIYDLFVRGNLYREYAEKELNPEQIDDIEGASGYGEGG